MQSRPRPTMSLVMAAAVAVALAAGCVPAADAPVTDDASAEGTFPVTVTDDAGRRVTIDEKPERIVSLAPGNTEIVAELGRLSALVGVTSYDDYPAEVRDITEVGDFAEPNVEAVLATDPDLVLATTGVQGDVIAQLEGTGAVVLAVDPADLAGLFRAIGMIGDATGEPDAADALVAQMKADMEDLRDTLGDAEPVRCFVEIAQDPLFTVGIGTLMDDLVTAAGGRNVVTEPGYVGYSIEQLLTDDPEVYMATRGSMSDPGMLAERPGFEALSAVRSGRVFVLEDNLVSRPGPRVVAGAEEIARALHPDLFGE